jgi:hypothetical protein
MSNTDNSDLPINGKPEWNLFERLEELEKIVGQTGGATLRETFVLASQAYFLTFTSWATRIPTEARRNKDLLISDLKRLDVNMEVVASIENTLTKICEMVEDK